MINLQNFGPGVYLTTEYIEQLVRAVKELQNKSIEFVQPPLTMHGRTLLFVGDETVDNQILFGTPSAAFTTGTKITLIACDVTGVYASGTPTTDVYVLSSQASYTLPDSTSIPMVDDQGNPLVVPYVLGDDEQPYIFGSPKRVMVNWQVDDTNLKFQGKFRTDFGYFAGTVSGWVDLYTNGQECPS